ncbi:MAG: chromate transporter, partial [Hyphomicrobiaceae bacterium]
FVLPGALVVLLLSALYAAFGKVTLVEGVFVGIKAAVLAVVVEALIRVARRALQSRMAWAIAAAAFAAIFLLAIPFPVIVLAAALAGFLTLGGSRAASPASSGRLANAHRDDVTLTATLTTAATWLAIWTVPLATFALLLGPGHVLSQVGWFFSKLAVVTFGGAYAVLAYMAQDVVAVHRWLSPGEMLDGLGLAETTPGPLILVTQFVGFLAAYREGGWANGLAGALVTLWATFAPCFLWIFTGAPYIERLNRMPRLKGALAGVTAAVVGVILNLTVWFALHVLFREVPVVAFGPIRLHVPAWATADFLAVGLAALAVVLLLVLHRGVITTLAVCGAAALAARLVLA